MTRCAVDAVTALRLLEDDAVLPAEHALVAPTVLRSHVLAALYGQVARGERDGGPRGAGRSRSRPRPGLTAPMPRAA